jgi:hypothetical protein
MKKSAYIVLFSILIAQCSSTKIISTYKSEEPFSLENGKIAILALTEGPDEELRKKMENHMADDLCNLGYEAVSTIDLLGSDKSKVQDEKEILKNLQKENVVSVLTIVLLRLDKEKYHAPAGMYDLVNQYRYSDFYPYYAAIYGKIYQDGYYINNTTYFWESNLYRISDQKLLYSVRTESFNPSGISNLAHQYGKIIIQNMLQENVIKELN